MELKRLLQIAITSVTFNATDTYMEEQEEQDTVCLREGMEEAKGEEGAGRSSAQLTLETQTDKEVNNCIVYGYSSLVLVHGFESKHFAESRSSSRFFS
jgi:hypothetical protein